MSDVVVSVTFLDRIGISTPSNTALVLVIGAGEGEVALRTITSIGGDAGMIFRLRRG
jgi:hypothetical protein